MTTFERPIAVLCAAVVLFAAGPSGAQAKVNLNTASEEELMKLPDVNQARARAIINYRKTTGEFIQRDELELIPQLKPIYGKLKDRVTVD